jgi:hypothetical protein
MYMFCVHKVNLFICLDVISTDMVSEINIYSTFLL